MSIAFASVIYRFRRRRPSPLLSSPLLSSPPHLDVSITRFRRSHSRSLFRSIFATPSPLEKQNLSSLVRSFASFSPPPSSIRGVSVVADATQPAAVLWWHAYNQDAAASLLSLLPLRVQARPGPPFLRLSLSLSPLRCLLYLSRPSARCDRRSAYFKQ